MEEEYQPDNLTSKFNEAGLQILRLSNLYHEIRQMFEEGKIIEAKFKIDSLSTELWSDAMRLDKQKADNNFIKRLKSYDKLIYIQLQKDISKKARENLAVLYDLLIAKEKLLKEIQDASGKGGKLTFADEDMM